MYVSGLTKSSCIADLDPTNCVCVKDLRSFALGSNEFVCVSGFTKLSTWIQDLRSYALGSNLIVWFRVVGDMCNVCGSVPYSYVRFRKGFLLYDLNQNLVNG